MQNTLSLRAKLMLVLMGTGAALCMVITTLTLFPGLLPKELRGDYYAREQAKTTLHITYRVKDGDMLIWWADRVRPPENGEEVLAEFTVSWDEDGFRVPKMQADHYPIAVFGDSFTEGVNVATPWADGLAANLNIPVYNYGYRGYGPEEIFRAFDEFADQEPRQWVLVSFYSGNDLMFDVIRSEEVKERTPLWLMQGIAEESSENFFEQTSSNPERDHYDFPMPVIAGANYYELAFMVEYLWAQQAPAEGFEASQNYQIMSEGFDDMNKKLPDETCRAVVYIPTKEELYYPYIHPSSRVWLRGVAQKTILDDENWLRFEGAPITESEEADFITRLAGQYEAMKNLAAEKGWLFIDLRSAFAEKIAEGELLYYVYDTHWNQAGHDFAAQVIAETLRSAGCL